MGSGLLPDCYEAGPYADHTFTPPDFHTARATMPHSTPKA